MSLFGRLRAKSPDSEPTPDWASFMGEQYAPFAQAVRADLDRRGLAYELNSEEGAVELTESDPAGQKFGLGNLAQVCHTSPRRKWAEVIREHFDILFRIATGANSELDELSEDFDRARPLLKVRLYPEDMAGREFMVSRSPAEGIVAALVYDLPDSIASVNVEHVGKWGRADEELFEIALANVREQHELKPLQLPGGEGAKVFGLFSDQSLFAATHALLLKDYLPNDLELGAVVAIPNRHAVLYHPIVDSTAFGALSSIIPAALGMYEQGPGSISPYVYWWQNGEFQRQPTQITGEGVQFNPTEEFIFQVLNRIRPESS